jgi:hypothetical protein
MSDGNKKLIRKIFVLLLTCFSLYLLYILTSILLNSAVSLKYEAVSIEDIEYCILYTKVLILYILLVLFVLIGSLLRHNKKR